MYQLPGNRVFGARLTTNSVPVRLAWNNQGTRHHWRSTARTSRRVNRGESIPANVPTFDGQPYSAQMLTQTSASRQRYFCLNPLKLYQRTGCRPCHCHLWRRAMNTLFAEYLIEKTAHKRHRAQARQDRLLAAVGIRSSSAPRVSVPGAARVRRLGRRLQAPGSPSLLVAVNTEGAQP